MSDKKYRDLDDFEEIYGEYVEFDEEFDENIAESTTEPIENIDGFIEDQEEFPNEPTEYPVHDIDVENHPNVKRIKRREKILGLLHSGVSKYNQATDAVMKLGQKRRKKSSYSAHPSEVTGIRGDVSGLVHVSGKNVQITTGPPNVSLVAKPRTPDKLNSNPTVEIWENNAFNSALVKPNKQSGKIVNKPQNLKYITPQFKNPRVLNNSVKSKPLGNILGITNGSILHTPVRKQNVANINIDLPSFTPKPARIRKQTAERATTDISEYLTDAVLKPKKSKKRSKN